MSKKKSENGLTGLGVSFIVTGVILKVARRIFFIFEALSISTMVEVVGTVLIGLGIVITVISLIVKRARDTTAKNGTPPQAPPLPPVQPPVAARPGDPFSVQKPESFVVCKSCGARNDIAGRFCNQCGGALRTGPAACGRCASCGYENDPGAKFCGGCGRLLR